MVMQKEKKMNIFKNVLLMVVILIISAIVAWIGGEFVKPTLSSAIPTDIFVARMVIFTCSLYLLFLTCILNSETTLN